MKKDWHKQKVLIGAKTGRTIGFPTVNLSPEKLIGNFEEGVYTCVIKYQGNKYPGVLYFGPRLVKGEKHPVLEIHILHFNQEIYGEKIEFSLGKFIRGVMNFSSMEELKEQIEKDIKLTLKKNIVYYSHGRRNSRIRYFESYRKYKQA